MSVKEKNKVVPITLPPFHLAKLEAICTRTGLSKSSVVQRMVEGYDLFGSELNKKETPTD